MMVRVEDPLVPRAMFGVLNTLLFFPSGAIYPISAFPPWLRAIAVVDPFTYAVHGFKAILLKDGGFAAIQTDILVPVRVWHRNPADRHAPFQAHLVAQRVVSTVLNHRKALWPRSIACSGSSCATWGQIRCVEPRRGVPCTSWSPNPRFRSRIASTPGCSRVSRNGKAGNQSCRCPRPARSFHFLHVRGGENVSTLLNSSCYRSFRSTSRCCPTS